MEDEQPKVLKKPPPNIGKKPEPKPKPAEEKKTAAPAKPSAGGKAPTGPAINDEEIGAGLSKEEAIEKVEAFYSSEHNRVADAIECLMEHDGECTSE